MWLLSVHHHLLCLLFLLLLARYPVLLPLPKLTGGVVSAVTEEVVIQVKLHFCLIVCCELTLVTFPCLYRGGVS